MLIDILDVNVTLSYWWLVCLFQNEQFQVPGIGIEGLATIRYSYSLVSIYEIFQ